MLSWSESLERIPIEMTNDLIKVQEVHNLSSNQYGPIAGDCTKNAKFRFFLLGLVTKEIGDRSNQTARVSKLPQLPFQLQARPVETHISYNIERFLHWPVPKFIPIKGETLIISSFRWWVNVPGNSLYLIIFIKHTLQNGGHFVSASVCLWRSFPCVGRQLSDLVMIKRCYLRSSRVMINILISVFYIMKCVADQYVRTICIGRVITHICDIFRDQTVLHFGFNGMSFYLIYVQLKPANESMIDQKCIHRKFDIYIGFAILFRHKATFSLPYFRLGIEVIT